MGNNLSNNPPPNYNTVLKSNEKEKLIEKELHNSIYHEICKHYNLGEKFNRLQKYFTNLTYTDIYSGSYINFVEIVEPKDKIIMSVFYSKYIKKYNFYISNLNKINIIKNLKESCNELVLDRLKNKLNELLKNYYKNKEKFINTEEILKELKKEDVKEALKSIFDLNDIKIKLDC